MDWVVALLVVLILLNIAILFLLNSIIKGERKQMSTTNTALAALQEQVAQNTSIEESAVTLIEGLAAQIAAAGTDPAALAALTASLQTSAADLAKAIAANTPAQPPVTQAPPPAPAA